MILTVLENLFSGGFPFNGNIGFLLTFSLVLILSIKDKDKYLAPE